MSSKILDNVFHHWTSGLSEEKKRISIFTHIRDIPYALVRGYANPIQDLERMLMQGKGSCNPKHTLLYLFFKRLDISIRLETVPFLWDDPAIRYPPPLRLLAREVPLTYHLTSRAYLNDRWVLLDATWDPPLKQAGFPVNESWDGYAETHPAVRRVGQRQIDQFRERGMRSQDVRERFYDDLNRWLETWR